MQRASRETVATDRAQHLRRQTFPVVSEQAEGCIHCADAVTYGKEEFSHSAWPEAV